MNYDFDYMSMVELANSDVNSALQKARNIETIEPNNSKNLRNASMIYAICNMYEKSIQLLERAINIDPEVPDYYYGLGSYYLQMKNYEHAAFSYQQCCKYSIANDCQIYLFSAAMHSAYCYLKIGEIGEAKKVSSYSERDEPIIIEGFRFNKSEIR